MPGMKIVGTNTADSTRAMAMTGPETSRIAFSAASLGDSPSSIWRSTASTTTMASSTTNPMARTRPNSDSVLIEKPRNGKKAKVPISETGTASGGYQRRPPSLEKNEDHDDHQHQRITERLDDLADPLRDRPGRVEGKRRNRGRRENALFASSMTFLAALAASIAFVPGNW